MIKDPKDRAGAVNDLPELSPENRAKAEEAEKEYLEFCKTKPADPSPDQVMKDLSLAIKEMRESMHPGNEIIELRKILEEQCLRQHEQETPVRQENRRLKMEIQKLKIRQDELLQTIARLSATVPFQEEIDGWQNQRAAMIAEIGTLKARIKELELK